MVASTVGPEPSATPEAPPAKLLAEWQGDKLSELDRTVWDMFSKAAAARPENDAIVSMWQIDDRVNNAPTETGHELAKSTPTYLRWSYRELYQRSVALASWLTEQGCQPRTCLAAFLWNSVEWGLFFWTSAKLGVTYAPLDPRVLLASDGSFFLDATNPAVLVVQDAAAASALESKLGERSQNILRIQCSGDPVPGWALLQDIWRATEKDAKPLQPTNAQAGTPSAASVLVEPQAVAKSIEANVESPGAKVLDSNELVEAAKPPGESAVIPSNRSQEPNGEYVAPKMENGEAIPSAATDFEEHSGPIETEPTADLEVSIVHESGPGAPEDIALIVFTSGTTSTPKGCPHTNSSLVAQTYTYDPNADPEFIDRWLVHTPVSHIFAVNNAVRAWRYANAVIFASKAFDVGATLQALIAEQCTIMSAVPTLVKALLANPLFPGKEALNLSVVTIGGTLIRPEDIQLCRNGLGAGDAIQAFGMSEGAPVISWARSDKLLKDGYHQGVGKILPGANVRICKPGTREVVGRNEVGELHIGGPPVITKYLGDAEPQSFYTDEIGNWLVTGDQARMDDDSVIYIIGRYKDLIIRGGENIPPIKLEIAISAIPGVIAQVVGMPDEIAGQVPIAVVKMPETVTKRDVMVKCRELGPMFTLDGVYHLSELGMEMFPMTALGKIKKEVLKAAVLKLRNMPPEPPAATKLDRAAEPVAESTPVVTAISTPAGETAAEVTTEHVAESVATPEADPTVTLEAEPAAVSETEPAAVSGTEPAAVSGTEPAAVSEAGLTTAPASEPVPALATKLTTVPATELPNAEEVAVIPESTTQSAVEPDGGVSDSTARTETSEAQPTTPVVTGLETTIVNLNGVKTEDPKVEPTPTSVVDQLTLIWEDLIGEKPSPDDSVATFADSITLLRYCDRVLTVLGQRLYIQDFLDNDTVAKQAVLMEQRSRQQDVLGRTTMAFQLPTPQQSPTSGFFASGISQSNGNGFNHGVTLHRKSNSGDFHMMTSFGSSKSARRSSGREDQIPAAAGRAVKNAGFGLGDIEDVMRIKDSFHALAVGGRPQTYHDRMVFRVLGADSAQVRRGIEAALFNRPIFRTILAQLPDQTPFHIILRPQPLLFDSMIQTMETEDDVTLERITKDGSADSHTSPFMARFQIISVVRTGEIFLSATYNHSIFDAMSILPWHLDLDRLIRNPHATVPPMTSFKLYADLVHFYQSSLPAQISVDYNVNRLRGISRFSSALWPIQRAPGWMTSDDCAPELAEDRALVRNEIWNGNWETEAEEFKYPRASRVVALMGMEKLRATVKVEPSLVMKAAITLFNVLQTGSQYAIFNTWDAARSWPFVPSWMDAMLPPPMSIDGPTTEWTLNLCEVRRNETVAQLLGRMSEEQEQLEQHAHAPWFKVLEGLGDEAEIAVEASFRQAFVWDVSMAMTRGFQSGSQDKALDAIGRYDWPDCGLFWNAFMVDKVNLFFIASWDTAQMNIDEVEGHCEVMSTVLRKLTNEANWDKTVAKVFTC